MKATDIHFEHRFGDQYPSQRMLALDDKQELLVEYRERLLRELTEVETRLREHTHVGILCG